MTGLFAINPGCKPKLEVVGGRIPVLIVDNMFASPDAVRSAALSRPYAPPLYPYPGRLAKPDSADPTLDSFLAAVLQLVNQHYLPRIPPIATDGRPISRFTHIETDFAITDTHPDALEPTQRKPHVDPVPIFGLVYLNREQRGGTLFFNSVGVDDSADSRRRGYLTDTDSEFALLGRIEGRFNRLAIYPGFVPHSGEIVGDWIWGAERLRAPRLTQRIVFFP